MTPPVFGITGWKNSGKTTLTVRLVAWFVGHGVRVATIKHAHHAFDIDTPGTDSFRHREAGASEVALVSDQRLAIMRELRDEPEPTLAEVLLRLGPADLVLVEGFKREPIPKIEARRLGAKSLEPLAPRDPLILAVASDHPTDAAGRPLLALDDTDGIGSFIAVRLGLGIGRGEGGRER